MPASKQIDRFMHCRECAIVEGRAGHYQVGLTSTGLQIWCKTHEREIAHFTPQQLAELVSHAPDCECCKPGRN